MPKHMPDFKTEKEKHSWIINNADKFTTVSFLGRGKFERYEYNNKADAEQQGRRMAAVTGRRYMVYACAGIHDTLVTVITKEGNKDV